MFGCKCCKILKAENDHLRKWIDRLMAIKAPEPVPTDLGALSRVGDRDDDLIFTTDGGNND